ncbi:unnamed protein product [Lupinus luteus]|uniref:Uncharacterized protein n=1 Tax=Lupinus luteus TaxID=3873 RepID=A0AAV1XUJ0_LUPLU
MTVTARINMASLDEGLIMGSPFIVIRSPDHIIQATSDDVDQSDVNSLRALKPRLPFGICFNSVIIILNCCHSIFRGLSSLLQSMDQGLICSSNSDLETMTEALYRCYYILQSSDNGPMLLKNVCILASISSDDILSLSIVTVANNPINTQRLAGAEEVLRVPENQLVDSSVNKEIENSVQACLLKIGLTDYDPLLHECGFHQKIISLVKESLQLGSIFPKLDTEFSELSPSPKPSPEVSRKAGLATDVIVVDEETMPLNITDEDEKTMACITEEWKQLVVNEDPKINCPSSMSNPKLILSIVSPQNDNRQGNFKDFRKIRGSKVIESKVCLSCFQLKLHEKYKSPHKEAYYTIPSYSRYRTILSWKPTNQTIFPPAEKET